MPADRSAPRLRTAGKFLAAGGATAVVRGLTYGPFGPEGEPVDPVVLAADLDLIAGTGANAVRVYTPPPRGLLDACAERGLWVFAGMTWASHVDFFQLRGFPDRIVDEAVETVGRCSGHPALAGWFVGNEIEAGLVRWCGVRRVQALLERLIDRCRERDPEPLYAYSNYPTTEFLNPRNADFVAFNLYLECRRAFASYLGRLQVIAGNRPLLVSEFGFDAAAPGGAQRQKEVLGWAAEECDRAGVAGLTVFSFTDEWWRGGEPVTGWEFGLFDAGRAPRPAAGIWERAAPTGGDRAPGVSPADSSSEEPPKVSVVVCTHNGAATLGACLESLVALDYPDYEILVVDDGSGPEVRAVVERAGERVRYLRQEHGGLSVARNAGAGVATGEVIAYTDDDCVADRAWLRWLAGAFSDPATVAAGGPNVAPPPRGVVEACVAEAPGVPAHVLIDDRRAEHLPGCNLAVRKSALDEIGGFNPRYRTAGDDVDFCWRLLDRGGDIGFVPPAMVWHHRRATVGAYVKQQTGYGRAEGLLMADHPERFGAFGGARWRGVVYAGGGPLSGADPGARVYHGAGGYAPFQFVYSGAGWSVLDIAAGVRWVAVSLAALVLLAFFQPRWCFVPGLLLSATVGLAACRAARVPLRSPWKSPRARWLLFALHLVQPVARGGARWWAARRERARPAAATAGVVDLIAAAGKGGWFPCGTARFWSEEGIGRGELVPEVERRVTGARLSPDDRFDLVDAAGNAAVQTVTEYHGGPRHLTAVRFWARVPWVAAAAVAIAAGAVALTGGTVAAGCAAAGVAGAWLAGSLILARARWAKPCRDAAGHLGLTPAD